MGSLKKNLQGNEAERLDRQQVLVSAVAPALGGEHDGYEPKVREDEVEQQVEAAVPAEDERGEEEGGCQDGLVTVLAWSCQP